MIRGAIENFCTLRVHRGGAQGADMGGSEGAKFETLALSLSRGGATIFAYLGKGGKFQIYK